MVTAAARRVDRRTEAAYRHLAGGYRDDPLGYAADVLGATLKPQQTAIPDRLLRPPYRLLVPSANKVGKTFAAAWMVNWFHDSFDPGVCLVTSASYRSVKTQVFKEIRRQRPLSLGLKPRAPEIYHHDLHQVVGFSTDNPDAVQGQHEANWLLIFDEATSVGQEIWNRAETMFSGVPGHGWLCFYNPNDPTTPPYSAEQSGGWSVHRLSALDHPNVLAELEGRDPPFPRAVRLARVLQRIGKECEDCGHTRVPGAFEFPAGSDRWYKPLTIEFPPQVLGRWADQSQHALWTDADRDRCHVGVRVDHRWPVQVGCDVARSGGNRTAFAVRHGVALIHLEERTHWPTHRIGQHIGDRLRELCHRYCPEGDSPREIPCVVDVTGGYGSAVTDYPQGYNFLGVNSSNTARNPDRFPNVRSELWQLTRDVADEGGFVTGAVREGAELVDQLWRELVGAKYTLDRKNRRVLEGKSSMIDRLGVSPDLADSVNLAWYPVAA